MNEARDGTGEKKYAGQMYLVSSLFVLGVESLAHLAAQSCFVNTG